jgi:lipid II:glycine glycyltransferase (peptidoglycan interpeptide bridge formation enzyme)
MPLLGSGGTADVLGPDDDVAVGEVSTPQAWDRLVVDAGGGLSQTWDWGELKRQSDWSPIRLTVEDRRGNAGCAQILLRRLGRLGTIGYLDGGPLVPPAADAVASALLSEIERACRRHRVRALIVDPPEASPLDESRLIADGYLPSHVKTALGATLRVDLRQSDDQIMSDMKSKTRYNIRKGLRSGVKVRSGSEDDLGTLHRLLVSTAERQGFVAPTQAYLGEMWGRLADSGRMATFFAEVDGETVAGILVTAYGEVAFYKRGAWNGRQGGAHPNEVLHWEAMRWAKQKGFTWYDFDGIERDVAESLSSGEDPGELTSVTRFKLGFGGVVVLHPRSMILIPNPVARVSYRLAVPRLLRVTAVKRLIKRLRSR